MRVGSLLDDMLTSEKVKGACLPWEAPEEQGRGGGHRGIGHVWQRDSEAPFDRGATRSQHRGKSLVRPSPGKKSRAERERRAVRLSRRAEGAERSQPRRAAADPKARRHLSASLPCRRGQEGQTRAVRAAAPGLETQEILLFYTTPSCGPWDGQRDQGGFWEGSRCGHPSWSR